MYDEFIGLCRFCVLVGDRVRWVGEMLVDERLSELRERKRKLRSDLAHVGVDIHSVCAETLRMSHKISFMLFSPRKQVLCGLGGLFPVFRILIRWPVEPRSPNCLWVGRYVGRSTGQSSFPTTACFGVLRWGQ